MSPIVSRIITRRFSEKHVPTGYYFQKNYMWNTITIQYNPLIEEEWDEHFKVTNQPWPVPPNNLRTRLFIVSVDHLRVRI